TKKKEGVFFVSCALRRKAWRGAPVGETSVGMGLGWTRVAQIHVARRAPSCVLHARCAGCWARGASTKSI
ncbi:hypothetical protein A2U01_0092429, partial [Trifolium medium]|nr:hypothetical protein [Trifolium medium]